MAEKAVLVGVEFTVRSRGASSSTGRARLAAARETYSNVTMEGSTESSTAANSIPEIAFSSLPTGFSSPSSSLSLAPLDSLAEFRELVHSAGGQVAAEIFQHRPAPDPATLVGAGKVQEIAGVAASTEADLVLFDFDLSPTQLRNLESAMPCRVLDRTQLILDIFARRARSSEG